MALNRDGLGRFAAAENSAGGNGGGANFAPPSELPETRQALLRYATSRPSRAPQIQSGGGLPEFPSPMDSHEQAYNAVMGHHADTDITAPIREAANAFNDAGEHSALRAAGYGGPESSGASDVASQFTPHMDFGGVPDV